LVLRVTALFASGLKCPDAQAAGNDHCNPGTPHGYADPSDLHWPLIQGPHSLKKSYRTEEDTRNDCIFAHCYSPIQLVKPNVGNQRQASMALDEARRSRPVRSGLRG